MARPAVSVGDGTADLVVLVLSPSGKLTWFTRVQDALMSGAQSGRQVTFDAAGRLIAVGYCAGPISLGAKPAWPGAGALDWFIAAYTPSKSGFDLAWWDAFGGAGNDAAIAVSTATNGDVLVGGYGGLMDFGAGAIGTKGVDAYAVLLDSNGKVKRPFFSGDGTSFHMITAADLTPEGDWMLAGYFAGSMTIGAETSKERSLSTRATSSPASATRTSSWRRSPRDAPPRHNPAPPHDEQSVTTPRIH